MSNIVCVPADESGNKLFLKELVIKEKHVYVKYRSTYNDIPFQETELFNDILGNYTICGEDGTVLWRINKLFINKLL
jgi:hypothetical protein